MLFIRQIKGISICSRLVSISCRNYNISTSARKFDKFASTLLINSSIDPHNSCIAFQGTSRITNEIGIKTPFLKKEILDIPLTNKIIEIPNQINSKIIDDFLNTNKSLDLPTNTSISNNIKQAARLIVIRKRKMRKHKLRKLRKKMKFVWAKAKQRREWKKEKRFLNGLLNEIKAAQKFSADDYVNEMIRKATENPPPRYYKNRRLPTWLILELLEKDKQKQIEKKYKFWEECGK